MVRRLEAAAAFQLRPHELGLRCILQLRRHPRRAARALQSGAIALHLTIFTHGVEHAVEHSCLKGVARTDDAVVNPLPFPSCRDDSRAAQIREVPRDLRLRLIENLDEVTDADLAFRHQMQQPQSRAIAKRLKNCHQIGLHIRSIRRPISRTVV